MSGGLIGRWKTTSFKELAAGADLQGQGHGEVPRLPRPAAATGLRAATRRERSPSSSSTGPCSARRLADLGFLLAPGHRRNRRLRRSRGRPDDGRHPDRQRRADPLHGQHHARRCHLRAAPSTPAPALRLGATALPGAAAARRGPRRLQRRGAGSGSARRIEEMERTAARRSPSWPATGSRSRWARRHGRGLPRHGRAPRAARSR